MRFTGALIIILDRALPRSIASPLSDGCETLIEPPVILCAQLVQFDAIFNRFIIVCMSVLGSV